MATDTLAVLADSVADTATQTARTVGGITDTVAQVASDSSDLIITILVCSLYLAILVFVTRAIIKGVRKRSPASSIGERVRGLLWVSAVVSLGAAVRLYGEFGTYARYEGWILLSATGILSLSMAIYLFIKFIQGTRSFTQATLKVCIKQVVKEALWVFILMLAGCWIMSEALVDTAIEAKEWAEGAINWSEYATAISRDLMGLSFIVLKVVNVIKKQPRFN